MALGAPPSMLPTLYGLRLMDDLRWGPPRKATPFEMTIDTPGSRSLSFAPATAFAAAGGARPPLLLPRSGALLAAPATAGSCSGSRDGEGVARAVGALRRLCLVESPVSIRGERCGLHSYRWAGHGGLHLSVMLWPGRTCFGELARGTVLVAAIEGQRRAGSVSGAHVRQGGRGG
jgi:hypothetical protein